MTGISHKQAIKWIHRQLDGMLMDHQAVLLDEHLGSCPECSTYAIEVGLLATHLQSQFHARWDKPSGSPQTVLAQVTARAQRIPITNRLFSAARLSAGAATAILLVFLASYFISRLQSTAPLESATETANNTLPATQRLLVFSSDQNGNFEVYTIHPDGSGMTNLTNHPANDYVPFWSPDGRRIAFESDRSGSRQVYLMDADGSNVIQLTQEEGNFDFDPNGYTPWSPDGSKLIVSHGSPTEHYQLYVLDITDKTITTLIQERGQYYLPSWSPDGSHIAFLSDTGSMQRDLFIVDSQGGHLINLTEKLPKGGEFFLYDYGWSSDGTSLLFGTNQNMYKATLDGAVTVIASATNQILNWWNDGAVRLELGENVLHWIRDDGSQSSQELCLESRPMLGIAQKRSASGNWLVGTNCSGKGWVLSWANLDGTTIQQLLDAPVAAEDAYLHSITWSADDNYIAFLGVNIASSTASDSNLYILDVAKARQDPSVQPVEIARGSNPHWQPVALEEVVKEKPTLAPTPAPVTLSMTVQEAEELAGFDILEPTYLPEGYAFRGAAYNTQSQAVILQYGSSNGEPQNASVIRIFQKRGDFPDFGLPSESHGTPVPVGNVTGKVTRGAWVYDSPDTVTPRWEESDGYLSLSWQKDGMSFSVDVLGGVATPPVELNELIAIAESLRNSSPTQLPPIGTGKSNGEWIAFLGETADSLSAYPYVFSPNLYLIHPDGTGLVNLTVDPKNYFSVRWSPDGQHLLFARGDNTFEILRVTKWNNFEVLLTTQIPLDKPFAIQYSWSPNSDRVAFLDMRDGNIDIYTAYADGRDDIGYTRLTTDPAEDVDFAWSPDGSQIAFQRRNGEQLSVMVMNADGSDQHEVARGTGEVDLLWSHDATALYAATRENNWLDCEGCLQNPGIYRIDLVDASMQQIYAEQDPSKAPGYWYMYDTPEDNLYFMRMNPPTFVEFWGTWFRWDGNTVREIGELDPQQTCQTTTGSVLNEYISPNERFSVISVFCAGGFDLYLADRESPDPRQSMIHILRLPSDTEGQGGDSATLPIRWSPDGRLLVYDNFLGTTYILDIEKAILDPEAALMPLLQPVYEQGAAGELYQTPDTLFVFDLTWQPAP